MIFDANGTTSSSNLSAVAESPYELGLKGALMHVYETECNYNAMMKAVGLSELKYYSETGKDLFVNEAGAMKGFVEKAKALFRKIIEKIKAIFKKFMAKINSFTMSDKEFVKKYEKEIIRKDVTDMEFTGYEKLKSGVPSDFSIKANDVANAVSKTFSRGDSNDSDIITDQIEKNRGMIVGGGSMTEAEFRDDLKEKLYGDKDTYDVTSALVRTALDTIKSTDKSIKAVEKEQKDIIKSIEDFIKMMDKTATAVNKVFDSQKTEDKTDAAVKDINQQTKNANDTITIAKAASNDLTVAFGMLCQAHKDANRQAKALCVKVLSYNKKESAGVSESATDDIFGGVEFA